MWISDPHPAVVKFMGYSEQGIVKVIAKVPLAEMFAMPQISAQAPGKRPGTMEFSTDVYACKLKQLLLRAKGKRNSEKELRSGGTRKV